MEHLNTPPGQSWISPAYSAAERIKGTLCPQRHILANSTSSQGWNVLDQTKKLPKIKCFPICWCLFSHLKRKNKYWKSEDVPFNFFLPLCCHVNNSMQYKLKAFEKSEVYLKHIKCIFHLLLVSNSNQVGYLSVNNQYKPYQIYAKI